MKNNTFYVTTPIYYANSEPHVGSAYTTLAADIVARYYRLKLGTDNVLFQVGTDEHGQKIAETAKKNGKEPKVFLDELVPTFRKAWEILDIQYDVFLRTTDEKHIQVAQELIQKIYDKGYIYEGVYEGLYCVGCEKYLTEKELVNGRCPLHPNREVIHQKEKNYFFKLSEFAPKVKEVIESGEVQVLPDYRKNEILNRITQGVEDISISREGVEWGIPIPWDKKSKATIWVWIEALLNYYSVTKYKDEYENFWPADLHIVGKDILWFHTVVWFSLLLAAELPLPLQVFGHGFFTLDGQKISKSLGNVITPEEFVSRYGVDASRYLIISATPFGEDRDIKRDEFDEKYTADLANGLGNLVSRVAAMVDKAGLEVEESKENKIDEEVAEALEKYKFDKAMEHIWGQIRQADLYVNENKVWELEGKEKEKALRELVDRVRAIAGNLQPFMPETAEKITRQFGGAKIERDKALFPRLG